MLSNLGIVEILLLAAVAYFAFSKNNQMDNKWSIMIVAAVVGLVFLFGGAQSSVLQGLGITVGGSNITLLIIVGAVLYFMNKQSNNGGNVKPLWLVLGGILLLSSLQSSGTL